MGEEKITHAGRLFCLGCFFCVAYSYYCVYKRSQKA